MKKITVAILIILLFLSFTVNANEISLFDGSGKTISYIDTSDELTIYLWDGKPVAYLKKSDVDYSVYGFNGKHLGWFIRGIIWDHEGHASCTIKENLQYTEYEPFKSFKQFKPFKSFTEFEPFKPFFSNTFGENDCKSLLEKGID
jgi:hypothetical protein